MYEREIKEKIITRGYLRFVLICAKCSGTVGWKKGKTCVGLPGIKGGSPRC